MKKIKQLVLSFLIALSIGGFSSVAMAEASEGRITYAPADAIDLVIGKIKEAQVAISEGKSSDDVYKIIKQDTDYSKEINANDALDRACYKANDILKTARAAAKNGNTKMAGEELPKAAKAFEDLEVLI